ncbi:MAG TPA: hypothetical protein VE032_06125 [Actinomycetota bacterium]|nr:hypothetical protein [Actinomycetota bacterium]
MTSWSEVLPQHVRTFFSNWSESDLPLVRRSAVLARNRARSLRNGGCCGHHGEPGC